MTSRPGLTILWALVLAIFCNAGPINRQAGGHNTLRPDVRNQSYTEQNVCVNDDVLYQPGDLMPAPTPCARCVCSPPGSLCTPVACEKKPGCKALQRPNQCCPEYQCECERNGRLYANGERLDNADNPCQACYCQGGEVVCTTVECYRRDDCEPQFVAGKCCPKYDHCPPLVMDDSRYGEPFVAGDRPQHTRATFQPTSGLEGDTGDIDSGDDDQVLGASNVQERVHVPQEASVATATTTPAPAPEAPAAATTDVPVPDAPVVTITDAPTPATDAPATAPPAQDTPQDAAIKIDVPAVPWTETPEPSATEATTLPSQSLGEEGSGAPDDNALVQKKYEPVIGVIERLGVPQEADEPAASAIDETATAAATTVGENSVKEDDATEAQTEQEPITRLFMISKEAELDPTTVSSEYTDIPEEMSTTPEATPPAKETSAPQDVDLSNEALLEATSTTKEPSPGAESSTDSSPEFKDFDEWSGSKSSEFLRDSASTGSSGGSSSGSDAHSKPLGSSSDESTSHFLATNINAETVKLPSDSSALPHADASSNDSTESSESTEESATTEASSTESENSAKTSENKDSVPDVKPDESISKEQTLQKIDADESPVKAEEESDVIQKSGIEKRQPDIVLDTEATDENGPPILLIGDDLANHQMDIVVATSSTEEAETETPTKPELRVNQPESTDQPTETSEGATEGVTDEPAATTEAGSSAKNAIDADEEIAQRVDIEIGDSEDSRTEKPEGTSEAPATEAAGETQTEAGSGDARDGDSSTEKLEEATVSEDMMLSDDPLPGQAASAETVAREENINQILGKTAEKDEDTADDEPQKQDGAPSATVLSTLPVEETTALPVEQRIVDLQTESPDRESTTNTVNEEEKTTLESKYETTTLADVDALYNDEVKGDDVQNVAEEKFIERRSGKPEEINQVTEDQATTEIGKESPTTDNPNTERTDAESNTPSELADDVNSLNEENTELVKKVADIEIPSTNNEQKEDSEKETKDNQPLEDSSMDTTTVIAETTNVPTTENSVTEKESNTGVLGEDVMLGDQPQNSLPATRLQSVEAKEQKKEEEKELKKEEEQTEQNTEQDNSTDKIQSNEQEEASEIKERVAINEATESTQKPDADEQTDLIQTTILEQSTESVQKSDSGMPVEQNTESLQKTETDKPEEQTTEPQRTESEQKDETEQKSETNAEPEQAEKNQEEEKEAQPTQILVESAKTPENNQLVLKTGDKEDVASEELSTPPPDTTSSDEKAQEDAVTSLPGKNADTEAPATENAVDATTGAPAEEEQSHKDTGVKINPEVLELKPQAIFPPQPESNATDAATVELDATTLSPEWLKSENDTKEDSAQGQKDQDQAKIENVGAEFEQQVSSINDEGDHQRLERRVDETDKKDLFLLEDFFTKLYRHQIATDANKEH